MVFPGICGRTALLLVSVVSILVFIVDIVLVHCVSQLYCFVGANIVSVRLGP